MTINTFVQEKCPLLGIELDCIWVKDKKGNYITAPGTKEFDKVEMHIAGKGNVTDLIFTV